MSQNKKNFSALALAACVLASSVFGFAGGYVSNRLQRGGEAFTEQTLDGAFSDSTFGADDNAIVSLSAAGASGPMTIAEAAAAVKQSVVEISTETAVRNPWLRQAVQEGAGSGVIVSTDGYIATNNHVVTDANSITVRLANGQTYPASVRGVDAKTDLAVLKIDAAGLTPVVFGDSAKLVVGQTSISVGNPLGELGGTVTCGIISALDRDINIDGENMTLMQTDAAVNPGNSGGGLFNLSGEIIGVVNAKSSGSNIEGIGFAIPINTVKSIMNDIIQFGYVKGRIDAGLTLVDISSAQRAMQYRVTQIGLYISASANNQLRSGDRITAIDGAAVTNLASYNAVMKNYHVGDTIQIAVSRDGQNITVPIVLGELKS
ncbi:MAG: trypsin-like peptidase domain-containing protein [Clostridiales bacterium]|jgi:serine protease Do|nr:trypsin-like peptidase domain-containing protein [Clostridiales bacterium]